MSYVGSMDPSAESLLTFLIQANRLKRATEQFCFQNRPHLHSEDKLLNTVEYPPKKIRDDFWLFPQSTTPNTPKSSYKTYGKRRFFKDVKYPNPTSPSKTVTHSVTHNYINTPDRKKGSYYKQLYRNSPDKKNPQNIRNKSIPDEKNILVETSNNQINNKLVNNVSKSLDMIMKEEELWNMIEMEVDCQEKKPSTTIINSAQKIRDKHRIKQLSEKMNSHSSNELVRTFNGIARSKETPAENKHVVKTTKWKVFENSNDVGSTECRDVSVTHEIPPVSKKHDSSRSVKASEDNTMHNAESADKDEITHNATSDSSTSNMKKSALKTFEKEILHISTTVKLLISKKPHLNEELTEAAKEIMFELSQNLRKRFEKDIGFSTNNLDTYAK